MADTLAVFDGNSLVHRAYHAVQGLTTSRGELVNAVYGFALMVTRVLADLKPTYAAVAFDLSAPTFRHVAYDQYKAQRLRMDDGLRPQFDRVRQFVTVARMPIFEVEGFEADDVLGTLARQAREHGIDTIIVTGDNDALQLVDEHIRVLTPRQGFNDAILYDIAAVYEKYGLSPNQVVDFKALKGDSSDNIKGVPGIGEKKAQELLREYGTLDRILEVTSEADPKKAKLVKVVQENSDDALRSRSLVTIVTDVPVSLDLEASRVGQYDRDEVVAFLRDLEFKSLLNRFPGTGTETGLDTPTEQSADTIANAGSQLPLFQAAEVVAAASRSSTTVLAPPVAPRYQIVSNESELVHLVEKLSTAAGFALDTETSDTDVMRASLVGISVCAEAGDAYYIPVGHLVADDSAQIPLDTVRSILGPILANPEQPKFAHNAKFYLLAMEQARFQVAGLRFDTMLASFLLESSQRTLGLKEIVFKRYGIEMTPITELIGRGKSQVTIGSVSIPLVGEYAAADADMTFRLAGDLSVELDASGLRHLLDDIEMPLVPVLAAMERAGIGLNVDYLRQMSVTLADRIGIVEASIFDCVGHRFNVNSPIQLASVLFEELHLPTSRRTKTGFSTDADTLEELRGSHEIVDLILEYRQLVKLKSTYVDSLPLMINPRTGRLHTSFNQIGAITGRISSSDPNLQNIPIRTEIGRDVRRAFVAGDPDHVLVAADYSQIELRILAHITGDERLIAAFEAGEDIHVSTAAEVFNVALGEVTNSQRRLAKSINYGVAYGLSEYGLAINAGIPRADASRFIDGYLARYSGIARYIDEIKRTAERQGYVETILGRRCYLPEIRVGNRSVRQAAERRAINAPIQGSSADMIKLAMIRLHHRLEDENLKSQMILQVHDELLFEAPESEVARLSEVAREEMMNALKLQVPVEVEVKVGRNWADVE
ncbi:MAG TPA: DNA polymerase I [Chloroflexota bacterium]|nr:DNA polymerase I [Chloroflexota bacterium]